MKKIAYCGGTFDILHYGHILMLQWAKDTFGTVVVALNTDPFIEEYKGRPPLFPYWQREEALLTLRCVDFVVTNTGGRDSRPAIEVVNPNVIVNGHDWTKERLMKQMNLDDEYLHSRGLYIAICPNYVPVHSSKIRSDFYSVPK